MVEHGMCNKFFKLIAMKKIPDAEHEFKKIQERIDNTKENSGYIRALEGLILARKSGDKNIYLARINATKNSVEETKKEFLAHASNELHDEYDRGYFKALAEYLKVVEDQRIWDRVSPTVNEDQHQISKD